MAANRTPFTESALGAKRIVRRRMAPSRDGGSYHLVLRLAEKCVLRVGALGDITFPSGYYVYTGSAIRGLEARVRRHLSGARRRHWHIDYLLDVATVVRVICVPSKRREECVLNSAVAMLSGARPVKRFGASDCSCVSHLFHFPVDPLIPRGPLREIA